MEAHVSRRRARVCVFVSRRIRLPTDFLRAPQGVVRCELCWSEVSEHIRFACAKCHGPLSVLRQELLCSSCGVAGRYIDGIPCFTGLESYRGETSPGRILEINRVACQRGWQAAIDQVVPAEAARIRDERQADFRHVFDLPPDSAILDVADHWGTIAMALGRAFSRVTVVEEGLEQARFIGLRARDTGAPVETVCGDFLRLPLAPEQFDAAVLNGIDGPESPAPGETPEVLLRLLHSIREFLKPRGFVCLGVENRRGWRGLESSFARHAARPVHVRARSRSLSEYQRIFRAAGYGPVRAFHSWNGSDDAGVLLPLESTGALVHFVDSRGFGERGWRSRIYGSALRAAARWGLWARCAPAVIFLAEKT